ncbi:MAG TPA: sodium-translocating pyrophosphatase [Flavobacteriales bacterium]|nr:sodium-translocating pyrophosphatase [Flavobacteriales bacterium]
MEFLYKNMIYFVPLAGLIGLLVMAIKASWVKKQDPGNDRMKEIGGYVAEGAMAFLKAEYRILAIYVVVAGGALAWLSQVVETSHILIVAAFVIGCIFSALAGFFGMRIATKANVRTTQAARSSLSKALKVSFTGGLVMGLGVAGLAVLGLSMLFILFFMFFMDGSLANGGYEAMTRVLEVLAGFSVGAESIALFARVGGGIYTKAADVGADLVGKVEAGIPEDDPRNPATIADNVGDNVGDVAGMGADLFGSYVATVLASMVLGNYLIRDYFMTNGTYDGIPFKGIGPILLPLTIAGVGLLASIVSAWFVRISDSAKADTGTVQKALNLGNWASILISLGAAFGLIKIMLPETITMTVFNAGEFSSATTTSMNVFYAVVIGMFVGAAISFITEFYTGLGKRPVLGIVKKSATGAATNIIAGLGTGMLSTATPVILFAGAIWAAYALAGFYGVGIAASAMMANTAMQLAIDAFGPIADNAGGVAEMSELPEEVREKTDILDSVGNTTAAIGKGFAIASAALTALALFAAYVTFTGIKGINIFDAKVLAALFLGGMIPVVFSALAINSVGKAAMDMVNEVRRQFREIPGIMEGKGKPEYSKCVEISTKAALREMMLPGIITIVTPIVVGLGMGAEALGAYMAGVTVSGVLWAIFQNNAGGAWDNAKKSFEKGVEIEVNGKKEIFYKKSEPHKAAVVGDTVGDPFKDTSGPSMNILIKLSCLVGLTLAPMLGHQNDRKGAGAGEETETVAKDVFEDIRGTFTIDLDESTLAWEAKKTGGSHNGKVKIIGGKLEVNEGRLSGGHFTLDMNSITADDLTDSSDNQNFLGHILSEDFFQADSFKIAQLVITSALYNPQENNYDMTGDLTIKGITKTIAFPATFSYANGTLNGNAAFDIDRTRWGISYNSKTVLGATADKFIYDEISFKADIKAKK